MASQMVECYQFRWHFAESQKMACYLKWEAYSGPISFEVQWNDIWVDNVQSCHSSSTALGTRTGYWKQTQRGTDETPPEEQFLTWYISCLYLLPYGTIEKYGAKNKTKQFICICLFVSWILKFPNICFFMRFLSKPRLCKEHCYRKKAVSVGQNGRLSASCNFFSFWLIKTWGTTN